MFSAYFAKITKLLNVFLRVNQKEAINELTLNKDILDILNDPAHSYLHFFYPDKCLNKRQIGFENGELDKLSLQKKRKAKQGKKISLFNLRSLSKVRIYLFIIFTFTVGIGYFFSNYYFWTITFF